MPTADDEPQYLTPGEAARLLHVSPKTVNRWSSDGLIRCLFTLGGHRRFPRDEIESLAARMYERQS